VWSADELVVIAARTLRDHDGACTAEQSVYGLDRLEELELHALLERGFLSAGYGVVREQAYPGEWRTRRSRRGELPGERERLRCDLVLTPCAGQVIADDLRTNRGAVAERAQARGTLFERLIEASTPSTAPLAPSPPAATSPGVVYWLEVKVVGQYTYSCGVPEANRQYASELVQGPVRDLRKLGADPAILHAGLLLVHFTAGAHVAKADQAILLHRILDRGLAVRTPAVERFPIPDRIGNTTCSVLIIEPSLRTDR
jgi:hypothetical protein